MRVCGVGRAVYRSALTYFSVLMLHDVYVRLYKCVLVLCSLIALEDEDMEIALSADSFSGFLHFPGNVSDFDKKTEQTWDDSPSAQPAAAQTRRRAVAS